MKACWAAPLGGCDTASKEHYFTKSLLDNVEVTVSGLPFLRGEPKKLPFHALTAHTLCRRHNTGLADLDEAAIDAMNVFRRLRDVEHARRRVRRSRWSEYTLRVDGPRFERWLLKVAFNISQIAREEADGWAPPREAVEIAYGLRTFPKGAGSAAISSLEAKLRIGERLACALLYNPSVPRPEGAIVVFAGYPFVCTWSISPAAMVPRELEGEWFDHAHHRLRRINNGLYNTTLEFDWSGQWCEDDNPEVVRLRARRPGRGESSGQ